MDIITRAMQSQYTEPVLSDDKPQGLKEYEECLRALREQLEARVKAAGEVG